MGPFLLPRTVSLVNSVLMLSADTPLSVADVARAANLAYTPTASALATMEKRRMARRTRRVRRDEYEPDKHSVYYPMAYGVALVDLPLREAFRGQRVYTAFAYGSLAQPGGGTQASDLDLLIVGDVRDRGALTESLDRIGERLNRVIDPFILSPEAFERARLEGDVHVASALGGVRLMGGA